MALEALKAGGFARFVFNKDPLCPHCGAQYDVVEHEAWELYKDDAPHDVDCGECGQSFQVTTHVTHSFSTDEQDDAEHDAEHD